MFDDAYRLCPFDGTGLVCTGQRRLEPGTVLDDRYLVSGPLGEGGTGLVYRAQDSEDGRDVVLKVIRPEHADSPEQVTRFLSELKVSARVKSPFVRQVLGTTRTPEGRLVLVLEYIEGRSLAEILAREGALPEGRALSLARGVAVALADVHAAGVVHRDVKPSNVLVSGTAPTESIVLLDLGVARQLDVPADAIQTRTGHVVGTPAYLSPEAILGDPVDARADLYALGVLLHEMLTGARPFEAPSLVKLMLKHLNEPPLRLAARTPPTRVHPRTDDVVAALLAKDAAARPASAVRAREMLEAILPLVGSGGPRDDLRQPLETLEARRPASGASPRPETDRASAPRLSLGTALADRNAPTPTVPDEPAFAADLIYELQRGPSEGEASGAEAEVAWVERLAQRRELEAAEAGQISRALRLTRVVGLVATLLALAAVGWLTLGGGRTGVEGLVNEARGQWELLDRTLDSWNPDQPEKKGLRRY